MRYQVYKQRTNIQKLYYSVGALLAATATILSLGAPPASALGPDMVANGSFEAGNVGFASDYTYVLSPGAHALWDEGTYTVGTDPHAYHELWSTVVAHSSSNMLIANGSTQANEQVWEQTVTGLIPGHVYKLSAFVTSVYPDAPASLVFSFNGTTIGSGITAGGVGTWTEFTGNVVIPAGVTSGTFAIGNSVVAATGNDFAIDDITLRDIASTVGKATGGIKFTAGGVGVQLDFVAMSTIEEGAKGNVKYTNTNGDSFMGKVTGYYQQDNQAYFVGQITKTNKSGWNYFYVAVEDNGEGKAASADQGVRVLVGGAPFAPSPALAVGGYDAYVGNVQVH